MLYILAGSSIAVILMVLVSLRRAHIRVEYSVSWLVAAAVFLLFALIPGLLDGAARWMGLSYPPTALVMIMGGVFLLLFFRLTVIISKLRDDNIALAQRVAILEYHINKLNGPVSRP